jgi:hypothetical protein
MRAGVAVGAGLLLLCVVLFSLWIPQSHNTAVPPPHSVVAAVPPPMPLMSPPDYPYEVYRYETEDEQQALPDYLQPHPPPPPINTLSAAQCAANLRDPTHIFRRMWAGAVGAHRL